MAIVIPSKHIYSRSFDPVIDNNISKVEIQEEEPSIIESNEPVAKKATNQIIDDNSISKNSNAKTAFSSINGTYTVAGSFVQIDTVKYTADITVEVSKEQSNQFVKNLNLGLSQTGDPNIKYTIYGDYERGTVSNPNVSVNHTNHTVDFIMDFAKFNREVLNEDSEYSLSSVWTDNSKKELSYTYSLTSNYSATASIQFDDKSTVSKTTATLIKKNNAEYLKLQFNILAGLRWVTLGVGGTNLSAYPQSEGQTNIYIDTPIVDSAYEIYTPKRVEVTIYGDVLLLELQENTVKIGNGNKVYSFDGNELIQTTNTPSPESRYQDIINKWKNGKQTVVISCPIADYYDENGNKVIDTSVSGKMIFREGDIVIPYIYTNKGDKPLSYNKDFTPKQFKVVGTAISKQQGVQQELTLQEV